MNPSLMSQLTAGMAQGTSPMNTVTPGAPTYQPSLVPPQNTPMPDKSPTSAMHLHNAFQRRGLPIPPQLQTQATAQPSVSQGGSQVTLPVEDQNPQQAGVQVPVGEAELIIKALTSRLQMLGKHESAVRDHLFPKPDFSESPTAGQSAQLKR